MASVGSGSPLANLAARAKAVQRTRAALGIGTTAPNGGVRPAAPPSPPPAGEDPAAKLPHMDFQAPSGVDPNSRDGLRAQAQQFLDQVANGGNQVTPRPSPVDVPPAVPTPDLGQSLDGLAARALPPDMQFQRLAGRPPSARELAVYGSYAQLHQELGRAPTRNELLYRVTMVNGNPGEAGIEPVV